MHILEHGQGQEKTLLFLPCTAEPVWAFEKTVARLAQTWHVFQVVYDGHEPSYPGDFTSVEQTVDEITDYLRAQGVTCLDAAYGCSLGGSFVGLLAARGNIRMDYGILGSSDLDQSSKFAAKLQTDLLLPLMFPMLRDGRFKSPLLQKRVEKQMRQMGDYGAVFLRILGGARPYLTQQSCKNQFYSDLITPLPDKLDVPGTEIHIFYALKMGEKYRARYEQHFAHPVIHEQDMQHEELLACHPQDWAALVKSIVGKEKST